MNVFFREIQKYLNFNWEYSRDENESFEQLSAPLRGGYAVCVTVYDDRKKPVAVTVGVPNSSKADINTMAKICNAVNGNHEPYYYYVNDDNYVLACVRISMIGRTLEQDVTFIYYEFTEYLKGMLNGLKDIEMFLNKIKL